MSCCSSHNNKDDMCIICHENKENMHDFCNHQHYYCSTCILTKTMYNRNECDLRDGNKIPVKVIISAFINFISNINFYDAWSVLCLLADNISTIVIIHWIWNFFIGSYIGFEFNIPSIIVDCYSYIMVIDWITTGKLKQCLKNFLIDLQYCKTMAYQLIKYVTSTEVLSTIAISVGKMMLGIGIVYFLPYMLFLAMILIVCSIIVTTFNHSMKYIRNLVMGCFIGISFFVYFMIGSIALE